MSYFNPYEAYNQVQIETADQKKLILMVYDAATRFCREACTAISSGNVQYKGIAIQKAYDAIAELRKSLDMERGKDVAEALNKLYAFLGHQLTLANLNNDTEVLNSVITVLTDMRDTWVEIFEKETVPVD
ncbi:flagellar export chaperone FliS [candidate division LCP-89 bacterium B3_LCP]|uniref:Flagellar secretion chaperone FliS n=1 Tax=candidate division LCP-89 bacterium B3_LCP TaxID=2012998 RepID=A0A532UZW3_UNCL8|nr:MAG: flagellar export chaperone FliS [candidate division LCP-89 bacterium B3_LCP]